MTIDRIINFHNNLNDKEKDLFYLGVLLLVSILIKSILFIALYNSPINNDGTLYINAARQYAMGNFANGLELYPMPVYPMLIAFVHIFIPDWIISGYLISFSSMIFVTIPLFFLIKMMFDNKVAFWAGLVFAVLPKLNEWSFNIIRDPLFLLLFVLSVYFALRSISEKDFFLFGATFVFAWFATLIRIEGVVFIGFYWFVLLYFIIFDKEKRIRLFLRSIIWICIPISLFLFVLLLSDDRSFAFSRFNQISEEFFYFINGDFLTKSSQIYESLSEIAARPPFFDGHYSFITLCRHFLPLIYVLGIVQAIIKILFPSSLLPLYFGFKDKVNNAGNTGKFIFGIWILFIGLGYYGLIKYDFIATRWLMIPSILLLPWIGLGINTLLIKARTSTYKIAFFFLIFLIIFSPVIKTLGQISSRDITTAYTLKWLNENDKINKVHIVSNNFKDSFYFDLEVQSDFNKKIHFYDSRKISKSIEQYALDQNAQIIIYKIKTKNVGETPSFHFFKKIKSITGNRYTILIFYLQKF